MMTDTNRDARGAGGRPALRARRGGAPRAAGQGAQGLRQLTAPPGEPRDVTLTPDMRTLAYFDDSRHAWVADAGAFELLVGTSSAGLPHAVTVQLAGEWAQPVSASDATAQNTRPVQL